MSDQHDGRGTEDLDSDDSDQPDYRVAWQQRQRRRLWTAIAVVAVPLAVLIGLGVTSSAAHPPSCTAQTSGCRETADGYWVPRWYYGALSLAQGTGAGATARPPSASGIQPSAAELEQAGATPDEAGEAESYAQSASSDGSADGSPSDGSGDSSASDGSSADSGGSGDVGSGDAGGGDAGGG